MSTNVPPEPDEFQTRMRQPTEGEVGDTQQPGAQPTPQPAQPQQPAQSPFAPPGFGSASQSQPPAGYGAPQQQPSQQPTQQQPTQVFGQQSFGQQSQAPQQQGWGQQQAPGGFAQQQPAAGYPQGGFGQQQSGAWGGGPSAPQQPRDPSPLKAAFDFSFGSYATPGIVKIVYVVGIVLAGLWYLIAVISAFSAFGSRDYGFYQSEGTIIPGLLMLLFGWIPAAFFILALRLALEHVLSSVRTAIDVRELRQRSDEETDKRD